LHGCNNVARENESVERVEYNRKGIRQSSKRLATYHRPPCKHLFGCLCQLCCTLLVKRSENKKTSNSLAFDDSAASSRSRWGRSDFSLSSKHNSFHLVDIIRTARMVGKFI
jgi:hypothetical protein